MVDVGGMVVGDAAEEGWRVVELKTPAGIFAALFEVLAGFTKELIHIICIKNVQNILFTPAVEETLR